MTPPKCQDTPENRALRVRSRIERRFEILVNRTIVMLPGFLADCDPHVAARIITDLLTIYLNPPAPDADGPDCLACVLEDIASRPENVEPADSPMRPVSMPADASLHSKLVKGAE